MDGVEEEEGVVAVMAKLLRVCARRTVRRAWKELY
jgi:hypothetical protein